MTYEPQFCDHCGASRDTTSSTCAPPFTVQKHQWTGKHPADKLRAAKAEGTTREDTEAHAKEKQILRFLTKRADWLKSEYTNGGDYAHLSTREKEVRYIIEKISRNQLD